MKRMTQGWQRSACARRVARLWAATLGLPGRGYGIHADYGMFKQNIITRQKESPGLLAGIWQTCGVRATIRAYKVLLAGDSRR